MIMRRISGGDPLDSVDKIIWILPVLAVLDVASTFYAESRGFRLAEFEAGFFASLAVHADLVYAYAVIYVAIIVGFSFVLWYIKKRLDPSRGFDKLLFLLLVVVIGYVYTTISVAFIGNFFLPSALERGINWQSVRLVAYGGCILSLVYYLWSDVAFWLRKKEEESEQAQFVAPKA